MKFINALSVKQKLILLVAIPALVLLFFAQSGIREGVASKAESSKIIILSTLSKHTSSMIHEMQKERGMSAGYLGSKGKKFATELPNQQNITNQKISSLKKYLETFAHEEFGEEFSNSLHGSVDQLDQLKNIRSSILSQNISLADGIGYYTNTNGSFLSLIDYLPKLTKNSTISNNAKAYSAFLLSKERAGIERAVLANVFAKNTFPPALYKKLLLLINAQDIYLDVYSSLATDEQIAFYKQTLNNPAVNETITLRKIALDNQSSGNFGVDATHWFAVQTEKINLLKTIENRLVSDLELQAQSFGAAASSQLIMASIPAIIVLALVFFAYLVAKSILTPISTMKKAMSSIIQTGDFSQRITINQEDEIAESSHSINDLLNLFENTISEVNQTVKQIADGNFDARVETILVGDLNEMKNGINETAISINTTINELINVMNALVVGNFNQRIETDLKGKFGELGNHVNQSVQGIANTMDALGEAMDALAQGNFKHRITSELNGDFAVFGQRVDNGLESVDMALSSINTVMESIATGSFDSRVDIELAGQLDEMKSSVNNSINILDQVFSDAGRVFGAVANGDLCEKIDHIHKGVFGQLAEDANTTVDKLTDVVKNIQESSRGVNSGAQDIAQGNKNLSNRTEQQAMNLEETAASMDEITTTVSNTANNASEANDLVLKAREQAISGGNVVKQAVAAMDEINNSSNRIAEIIGVIDEIAFQTNLLALNASVEAARAGEQGRGFAVVASEVRNLAGRSATAAKEIKDLIEDSVQKVRGGSTLVGQSGKTLEEIVDSVQNVTDIVAEIATAASEQSLGVSEVHKSLEQLQTLTQQNTAMVEEAAAASEELGDQSRGLNQMIQFFNIEKNITAIGNARKSSFKEKPSVATNKAAGQDFNNNDSWEEF